jgi:hypothetical protein
MKNLLIVDAYYASLHRQFPAWDIFTLSEALRPNNIFLGRRWDNVVLTCRYDVDILNEVKLRLKPGGQLIDSMTERPETLVAIHIEDCCGHHIKTVSIYERMEREIIETGRDWFELPAYPRAARCDRSDLSIAIESAAAVPRIKVGVRRWRDVYGHERYPKFIVGDSEQAQLLKESR